MVPLTDLGDGRRNEQKIGDNKLKQRVAVAMVKVITVVVVVVIVKVPHTHMHGGRDGARVRREPVYGRRTRDTLTHLIDRAGGQDACGVH